MGKLKLRRIERLRRRLGRGRNIRLRDCEREKGEEIVKAMENVKGEVGERLL